MKLKFLHLKNFKGIKDFSLAPGGDDISVSGANATGKTTLMDGFLWLLFGKDSLNRTDFELKFIHPNGQVEHNLEHEVSAVLDLDGEELTLTKRLTEKWTRKRGAAAKEFTGHETQHFIDGVPVNQRDYQARIAQIAPEETFRLLTNPRHFSEHLKWQERRRMLLDVCGDVSDVDVIASDPALAELPEILGNRKLEDHRKVLMARRTEINKELEQIPVRISELTNSLPADNLDTKFHKSVIAQLRSQRTEKEAELLRLRTGGEKAKLAKELAEVEAALIRVESKARLAVEDQLAGKRQEKQKLLTENEELRQKAQNRQRMIDGNKTEIANRENALADLRLEWARVDAEEFTYEELRVCPTCGQGLPEEQVEAARAKALANFNEDKARRLGEISAKGKGLKEKTACLAAENSRLEAESMALFEKAGPIAERLRTLENEIRNALLNPAPIEPDEEEIALTNRQTEIEQALSELEQGSHDVEAEVKEAIAELNNSIMDKETDLANIEASSKSKARIEELKRQERKLAEELERIEKEVFLSESFICAKVSMLTEKINARFRLARFKLFEQQVNGALAECCDTTVNGVPYHSLNNAARIQAGMDIVRTLQGHHGVTCPVFVDNAESVTTYPEMDCQVIKLYVSEPDKVLRVEVESGLKEVVNA